MDRPDVSFEKGEMYREMGLLNEAIAEYEKTLSEESLKYRAIRRIAACLVAQESLDKAESILLQSLLLPTVPTKERLWVYSDLADLRLMQGRIESAVERLVQIRNEDPGFFPDLSQRIEELSRQFDSETVLGAHYRNLIHGERPPVSHRSDAETALGRGGSGQDEAVNVAPASPGRSGATEAVGTSPQQGHQDPRRKWPRVKLSNRIEYSFDQGTWATGYTSDLSVSGMFVLTYEPVPVGSVVFLRFDLPRPTTTGPLEIIGQAVRQQDKQEENGGVLGMGVHFISMDQEQKRSLAQLVSELMADEQRVVERDAKVRFHCDNCGRMLTATESASGKFGKCVCGASVPVPFTRHTPSEANPLRGMVLAGCRIDRVVGKGSVASVYKGHHLTLDIPVAIKILKPALQKAQTRLAQRFLSEARAIARIKHANIVAVMNAGEEKGLNFIVMQYVMGKSLQDLLSEGHEVEITDFIRIAVDICNALEAAHEFSCVHGDIKPANILLTPGGTAMLVDFGLVKDLKSYREGSHTGIALGTPLYMSPEQARGEHAVDTRSDIYSLGATLYHLAARRPPFGGFTNSEVIRQHTEEPLVPLITVMPNITQAISDAIGTAMAKQPADRFQSAGELKQEFLRIARNIAIEQFRPIYKKMKKSKPGLI